MTDQNNAAQAASKEIHEAFELHYAMDADDPANATDLSHFTNGWRACIMSQVRASVADAPTWNDDYKHDVHMFQRKAAAAPVADERTAFKKCHSVIIKALSSIARADGPDTRKADDPELLYRSPVMDDVVRIRVALDECSAALASAPVAGDPTEDEQAVDSPIKAAYVEHFGHAAGWLSYKGSWFVEGFKAAQKCAPVAGEADQPAEYQRRCRPIWENARVGWTEWERCTAEQAAECEKAPLVHDWQYEVRRLYAAPQASKAVQEFIAATDAFLASTERKTWTPGFAREMSAGERILAATRFRDARAALVAQLPQEAMP